MCGVQHLPLPSDAYVSAASGLKHPFQFASLESKAGREDAHQQALHGPF